MVSTNKEINWISLHSNADATVEAHPLIDRYRNWVLMHCSVNMNFAISQNCAIIRSFILFSCLEFNWLSPWSRTTGSGTDELFCCSSIRSQMVVEIENLMDFNPLLEMRELEEESCLNFFLSWNWCNLVTKFQIRKHYHDCKYIWWENWRLEDISLSQIIWKLIDILKN